MLIDQYGRSADLIAGLEQPVRTATIAGVAAGVVLSTVGAVFLVRRRRRDFRLLAADGDSFARFFGRAIVQYAAPAPVGALVGVLVATALVTLRGPGAPVRLGVVPWSAIGLATIAGVVAAALVTALLAVRLVQALDVPLPTIGGGTVAALAGAAAVMWIQMGERAARGTSAVVVAFPFVGILAGVALAVTVLRYGLRHFRRRGARLPTPLFLAWRAVTSSEAGTQALTVAIGLAAGMAMLASTLVTAMDGAASAKAYTVVGARTRVNVSEPIDPSTLPPGTTVLRTRQATGSHGGQLQVIAIDPVTFADGVGWPDAFGSDPADVVERLGRPSDGAVTALAVDGFAVPPAGEFGSIRTYPYQVVGTIGSAPLAADSFGTIVVRADMLEAFARA